MRMPMGERPEFGVAGISGSLALAAMKGPISPRVSAPTMKRKEYA